VAQCVAVGQLAGPDELRVRMRIRGSGLGPPGPGRRRIARVAPDRKAFFRVRGLGGSDEGHDGGRDSHDRGDDSGRICHAR
jgi:hypothetical protein